MTLNFSLQKFTSFIFVLCIIISSSLISEYSSLGTKFNKNFMKQGDISSISGLSDFISSYNNTSTYEIDTKKLTTQALVCYTMLQPIVDSLPNGIKKPYAEHINKYASDSSCGDSSVFAESIKYYFSNSTSVLSNILTKASKQSKQGLSCFNSASVVKQEIRDSYDDTYTRSERISKFKNTIDTMSKYKQTQVLSAKASLSGAARKSASVFLQLSKAEKTEILNEKEYESNKKLSSLLRDSFIQTKLNSVNGTMLY